MSTSRRKEIDARLAAWEALSEAERAAAGPQVASVMADLAWMRTALDLADEVASYADHQDDVCSWTFDICSCGLADGMAARTAHESSTHPRQSRDPR